MDIIHAEKIISIALGSINYRAEGRRGETEGWGREGKRREKKEKSRPG